MIHVFTDNITKLIQELIHSVKKIIHGFFQPLLFPLPDTLGFIAFQFLKPLIRICEKLIGKHIQLIGDLLIYLPKCSIRC